MRRRAFLGVLSGAAVAWPFAAPAQQAGKLALPFGSIFAGDAKDDPEQRSRLAAFWAGVS